MEPLNPDEIIWRYLGLANFVHLISSQSLFFSRADRLEDPFEGTINFTSYKAFVDDIEKTPLKEKPVERVSLLYRGEWVVLSVNPKDIRRHMYDVLSWFRSCTYVNCWHRNTNESDAMWKLYSKNLSESVVIRTTVNKLQDAVPAKVSLSPVKYVDYQSEYRFPDFVSAPFTTKRISFSHEREARLIFLEPPFGAEIDGHKSFDMNKINTEAGELISLNISLDKVIDEIRLSPLSQPWMKEVITNLLEKFNVNIPVKPSEIQIEPFILSDDV
jgi:hypothetical protein